MDIHIYVAETEITVTVFDGDRLVNRSVFDHNSLSHKTLFQRIGLYRRRKGTIFLCNDITFVEECFAMHGWRIWLATFDEVKKIAKSERNRDQ